MALDVARGPADDLDERPVRAEVALFVSVQDADERDLRQVETLAQQVDADHHVHRACAQVAQHVDALHRIELGMEVADLHPVLAQVVREVLRKPLRQRRHE